MCSVMCAIRLRLYDHHIVALPPKAHDFRKKCSQNNKNLSSCMRINFLKYAKNKI